MLPAGARVKINAMRRPVLAAILLIGLAGCGGGTKGNGEASKSPTQILADMKAAVLGASSVHVAGGGLSEGAPLRVDLRLVAGKGGKGRVTANGITFDMVRIDGTAYFKAGAAFWRQFGGGAAAQLLQNRWLKASATTGRLATFTPLTDIAALFNQIVASHGALEKVGESKVGDVPVVGIRDKAEGGTLYIATTGEPYPIALRKAGSGGISFDGWNEAVTLEAPAGAIDMEKLGSG
jgi:hypothetical protein